MPIQGHFELGSPGPLRDRLVSASVAEWREAHEGFWRGEVVPALRQPVVLDDETEVVVERFWVVGESN